MMFCAPLFQWFQGYPKTSTMSLDSTTRSVINRESQKNVYLTEIAVLRHERANF